MNTVKLNQNVLKQNKLSFRFVLLWLLDHLRPQSFILASQSATAGHPRNRPPCPKTTPHAAACHKRPRVRVRVRVLSVAQTLANSVDRFRRDFNKKQLLLFFVSSSPSLLLLLLLLLIWLLLLICSAF